MGDRPEAIEGQAKLFRVLTAFARYNPQIGYVQGNELPFTSTNEVTGIAEIFLNFAPCAFTGFCHTFLTSVNTEVQSQEAVKCYLVAIACHGHNFVCVFSVELI